MGKTYLNRRVSEKIHLSLPKGFSALQKEREGGGSKFIGVLASRGRNEKRRKTPSPNRKGRGKVSTHELGRPGALQEERGRKEKRYLSAAFMCGAAGEDGKKRGEESEHHAGRPCAKEKREQTVYGL